MKKMIEIQRVARAIKGAGAASLLVAAAISAPFAAQATTVATASATTAAPTQPQPQSQSQSDAALIAHGEYLARAGDCIACHSTPAGKPFAGGLKFDTPIGAIYSTNITPDRNTGIGSWTFAQFDRAVRAGVKPNGDTLYPAMPFPSYARLNENDMHALYAYFTHGVAPVNQANRAVDIVWPLSMRWPLGIWRHLFAPEPATFNATHYTDPVIARGAYLVQGLGHCGACHTPRAVTMQERSLTDLDGSEFLAGGTAIDGWVPSSLRANPRTGIGAWSEADLVQFLKTGRTQHSAAFGGMTDVVQHSMQHMSDADLTAIARYLKTLPSTDPKETPYAYNDTAAHALRTGDATAPGAAVYRDNCTACHRSDGRGYNRVFPALGGNPVVQGKDATSLIHVLLTGSTLEGTKTAPSSFTMPPFGWRLNDQEVADVTNFVRTSWGNAGSMVSASDVAKVRKTVTVHAPDMPPGASLSH
ncbi:c-type cytochrome [Paraburkholderia dilworthii]|uniref:Cytochrome c n=1 Tax=Paraburkholderia dilworthii TaxID=948106 RepID=A0ABW9D0K9_9BURK